MEFESPIEQEFGIQLHKWISDDCELLTQQTVVTQWGRFRFDFVCNAAARRVVFECDGKEFHDEFRDELRDAVTLGGGFADAVYRIPGYSIMYHLEQSLFVISQFEPQLFSDRGRMSLQILAGEEADSIARDVAEDPTATAIFGRRWCITRRAVDQVESPTRRVHWRRLFERAQSRSLDQIYQDAIDAFKSI